MAQFLIPSGAMQTSAALASIATGVTIKTLLQFKPSATIIARIIEYGISFNGFVAALPGKIELIETDVGATVTASVAADITKMDEAALLGGDPTTNLMVVGVGATGYNATAEAVVVSPAAPITTVRNLDAPVFLPPTAPWFKQFPLGCRPVIQLSKFARIRVTFGTDVAAFCYMIVEI